jgi:fructose-1,6-bisphosphatase I/sedoheptulose-1,7-bisphosphatase
VQPSALHQRVGLVFGSREEVDRIERYHHDPQPGDLPSPLFYEHGLFRAPA